MSTLPFITLEALIAQMPGYVYWVNRQNIFQGCNNLVAKLLGLGSRHDIVGKTNRDIQNAKIAKSYEQHNFEVMHTGIAKAFEELFVLPDGTPIFFLAYKQPLFDETGNIVGVLGNSLPITEEEQRAIRLKKEQDAKEQLLENIATNLPGHVYWLDCNNVILKCNDLTAKNSGFRFAKEMFGKTTDETCWKSVTKRLNKNNAKVRKTGKEHSLEESGTLANGKYTTFLSKKAPLRDDQGNIIGISGVSFEITDQKS